MRASRYKQIALAIAATSIIAFLAGCASPKDSNKVYGRNALSSATRTIEGQIVSKRAVQVDPSSGVGGTTGGALGAIAGSGVGGGSRDNLAGVIIGAVAGATIGAAIDSASSKIDAFEYIVKSDVAGLLTIIQTDNEFNVGQKVYVILGDKPVLVKGQQ